MECIEEWRRSKNHQRSEESSAGLSVGRGCCHISAIEVIRVAILSQKPQSSPIVAPKTSMGGVPSDGKGKEVAKSERVGMQGVPSVTPYYVDLKSGGLFQALNKAENITRDGTRYDKRPTVPISGRRMLVKCCWIFRMSGCRAREDSSRDSGSAW